MNTQQVGPTMRSSKRRKLFLIVGLTSVLMICSSKSLLSAPLNDSCSTHFENAKRLMDMGKYKEALSEFTESIRSCNSQSVIYACRAAAYSKLGDHRSAVADCDTAIKLDPLDVLAYMNRCCAYVDLGAADQSIEDGNKAISLNSEASCHQRQNPKQLFLNRGRAFFILGAMDNALADFSKAIELDANYAVAYHNRAIAYREKRDGKQATADFVRAAQLYSKSGDARSASACLREVAKLQGR